MIVIYHTRLWEERMTKKESPRYWRAVNDHTGTTIKRTPAREPRSWDLASDGVDLRLEFVGQANTVTLELVDAQSGRVLERVAPMAPVTRLSDERVAELMALFAD